MPSDVGRERKKKLIYHRYVYRKRSFFSCWNNSFSLWALKPTSEILLTVLKQTKVSGGKIHNFGEFGEITDMWFVSWPSFWQVSNSPQIFTICYFWKNSQKNFITPQRHSLCFSFIVFSWQFWNEIRAFINDKSSNILSISLVDAAIY